jgi:enamine deaminase RidA (YjgF/YER057c/UK114 family)
LNTIVNPASLARPSGYSHGIRVEPGRALLALAGQVAWDGNNRIVSDDFAEQFEQALANVLAVVAAGGGAPESVVKLTLFVTNKDEYIASVKNVGERYRRLMGTHYPAMTLVEVKALLEVGAKIEIEGLAAI